MVILPVSGFPQYTRGTTQKNKSAIIKNWILLFTFFYFFLGGGLLHCLSAILGTTKPFKAAPRASEDWDICGCCVGYPRPVQKFCDAKHTDVAEMGLSKNRVPPIPMVYHVSSESTSLEFWSYTDIPYIPFSNTAT